MNGVPRVALFVTCVVDQVMPEVGVAATRLLRRAGFTVDFPPSQTCCGQPFFNSGHREPARALARRTVELLAPYEAVVLPSGSCTSMIRLEYPHLLADNLPLYYAARRLAARSFELSEFLAARRPRLPAPVRVGKVTYHDSCHMKRLLGLGREPRQLLQTAGFSVCEMAAPDECCGFGGLFSLRMPEVSNAMTARKLHQARETEARVIVTADPGCLLQMRGLAPVGDRLRVQHLAQVLWDGLPAAASPDAAPRTRADKPGDDAT